ncbi:MAG: diheme cytochrome c [Rhodocyclaceae bacterium]|nr:diheme cytochrome c [Rhodocyclaceae bacterium]
MKRLALITLLGFALPAFADRMPLPANTPASFKAECASCHLAYPPALLAAKDWQRTMAGLKDHFGTDATVDAKTAQEITAFLERNAGNSDRLGSAGEPPRITQTARFIRKHREVSAKTWSDPRVKSAANCEACHRGAANGSFSEREITLPSGLK